MNWGIVLLALVFLTVFFLISVSLLLYLRHWSARHGAAFPMDTEGRYFKRYIPDQLRPEYDSRRHGRHHSTTTRRRSWLVVPAALLVVSLALTLSVSSLTQNSDLFLKPIDITRTESERLNFAHHEWHRDIDDSLPDMSAVLAAWKHGGFIVPYDKRDLDWLHQGVNLRRYSLKHWYSFSSRHQLPITYCDWSELSRFMGLFRERIVLVLPGFWDFRRLNAAIRNGANVLVYGPPAQLFSGTDNKPIRWHGLEFEKTLKGPDGAMALRGDQVLTLGFDAGLVLNVYSPFSGFRATSASPQALAIGADSKPIAEPETRLYATAAGKGRLVWTDFAPNPQNHSPEINVTRLNAVMASIFRYFSRHPYSTVSTWPQARTFAGLIEQDTEHEFENAESVIEMLQGTGYPISWYVLSNEALKHRQLVRDMAAMGEIACHGDTHQSFTESDRREQTIRIARCQKVLTELTGARPLAFRPPREEHGTTTLDAIANNGMTHFIASNASDRSVPEILVSHRRSPSLVSIPRLVSDDFEMWHTRSLDYADTVGLMDKELAWSRQVGGLYAYSFHTQYMDRQEHRDAILYLGKKLSQANVYFANSRDIADWWRLRRALQRGEPVDADQLERFKPTLLTVNARGQLLKAPYPAGQAH